MFANTYAPLRRARSYGRLQVAKNSERAMKKALVVIAALPIFTTNAFAASELSDAQLDGVSAGFCIGSVCTGPAQPGFVTPQLPSFGSGVSGGGPVINFPTTPTFSLSVPAVLSGLGAFSAQAGADAIGRV
jgi:hypothetical protein